MENINVLDYLNYEYLNKWETKIKKICRYDDEVHQQDIENNYINGALYIGYCDTSSYMLEGIEAYKGIFKFDINVLIDYLEEKLGINKDEIRKYLNNLIDEINVIEDICNCNYDKLFISKVLNLLLGKLCENISDSDENITILIVYNIMINERDDFNKIIEKFLQNLFNTNIKIKGGKIKEETSTIIEYIRKSDNIDKLISNKLIRKKVKEE